MLKEKEYGYKMLFIFSIICFWFIEQDGIKKAPLNILFGSTLLIYFFYQDKLKIKLKEFKLNILFYIAIITTFFHILGVIINFYNNLKHGETLKKILSILLKNFYSDYQMILLVLIIILGIFSSYGIFILWINFFHFIFPLVVNFFKNIKKYEKNYFLIFLIIFFCLIFYSFYKTNIFYFPNNGEYRFFDIIFTSDSGLQYSKNVFLNILTGENDIRQPLFGLFSLPFSIIAYILSYMLFFLEDSYAILLTMLNIVLIGITNILISRMLPLKNESERILFLIFFSSLYPTILFSLLIEQYVISIFYIILYLYLLINKYKYEKFIFIGMAGTMITSCIFGLNYLKFNNLKESFRKIKELILLFITFVILVGYSDVILGGIFRILDVYGRFGGEKISFLNKMKQYFSFIVNCFIAPNIIQIKNSSGNISIQLIELEHLNIIGLIILIISIINAFFYKKSKFILNCLIWVIFSGILFCIIGWGTSENGLILYSYYFSWAFSSLIFIFLRKIIKNDNIFYCIILISICYFLYVNLNGIMEIIKFGVEYYPKI